MKKKTKKIILISLLSVLIAIVLIAILAYFFVKDYYSQEKALERMFTLRAEMNLEEYYECFDIPEESKSYMNSLDSYLLMAQEKNWGKIDSFEITQKRINTYSVKYGDVEETLELIKQNTKSKFGFDTYKIKIESVTSPLLYMVTHIGAEATIDGKSIESDKVVESEIEKTYFLTSGENDIFTVSDSARNAPIIYFSYYDELYDNYCFTNVFDREYELIVKTDYTDTLKKTLLPSEEPYIIRELKLNENSENEIKELGESFIKKYYYALQNGDDFESIAHMISEKEECREFFANDYEESLDIFTRDENTEGLVDICFLDSISTVNYPGVFHSNQQEYTVITTLDYSYNSISYNPFTDEYERNNDVFDSYTFNVSCIKENGKWVVSRVDDTLISFS